MGGKPGRHETSRCAEELDVRCVDGNEVICCKCMYVYIYIIYYIYIYHISIYIYIDYCILIRSLSTTYANVKCDAPSTTT